MGMSDQLTVDGKEFISSKRASDLSGYTQDYIGQIARKGLVEARRIGGLWYIGTESLMKYKAQAEEYVPQAPKRENTAVAESLITLEGKDYISTGRAAELTGYHEDYVGQLARKGTIPSQPIGNRWFIERQALLDHKREKDALLAAVQANSVGLARKPTLAEQNNSSDQKESDGYVPYTYISESGDLRPFLAGESKADTAATKSVLTHAMPHHVLKLQPVKDSKKPRKSGRMSNVITYSGLMAAGTLAIFLLVSLGVPAMKQVALRGVKEDKRISYVANANTSAVTRYFEPVGRYLEAVLTKELIYRRSTKDF
ncbi:MAG: hypothetical protein RLZZ416_553 [Candidatus Parcubacteria bacterium]|jgi:excisionase family DNA binding protein